MSVAWDMFQLWGIRSEHFLGSFALLLLLFLLFTRFVQNHIINISFSMQSGIQQYPGNLNCNFVTHNSTKLKFKSTFHATNNIHNLQKFSSRLLIEFYFLFIYLLIIMIEWGYNLSEIFNEQKYTDNKLSLCLFQFPQSAYICAVRINFWLFGFWFTFFDKNKKKNK